MHRGEAINGLILQESMRARLIQLEQYENMAMNESRGMSVPQGNLRVAGKGKYADYYHVEKRGDTKGEYISKNNMELAIGLANKEYNEQLLKTIIKEKKAIKYYMRNMPQHSVEEIYDSLNEHRKKLVSPIAETKEQFIQRYTKVDYPQKGFADNDPEYYTEKGERVRSKTEILIANSLFKAGIPYVYERPVYFKGVGYVYTDFTILDIKKRQVKYYEHFGRMEDEKYVGEFFWKISTYYQHGIILGENLFATFESKNHPLKTKDLEAVISCILGGIM